MYIRMKLIIIWSKILFGYLVYRDKTALKILCFALTAVYKVDYNMLRNISNYCKNC